MSAPIHSNETQDKLLMVGYQLNDVRSSLSNNLELAMDRGEKIETMEAKSDELLERSKDFRRDATKLKWKMCRQHWKLLGAIVFCILLVILILVLTYKH